jgi:phospholipase C
MPARSLAAAFAAAMGKRHGTVPELQRTIVTMTFRPGFMGGTMRRFVAVPSACLAFTMMVSGASAFDRSSDTATPIKHLVVIFQENNSFDHYFGTYPHAANPPDEPRFEALPDTPSVNGLSAGLLDANLNSVAPFRLDRSQQALDCDNSNAYAAEQAAYDHGLMDKFPENTSSPAAPASGDEAACPAGIAMGYYDGNTVTALWNYAQYFAMSDNFYDTEFGATLLGHLNLISGQTHQTNVPTLMKTGAKSFVIRNGTVIANLDSGLDDCRSAPVVVKGVPTPVAAVVMSGHNVGDLLNNKGVTWGWFYGDFTAQPGSTPSQAVCSADYDVHYDPFQYYPSTANPHHLPPSSVAMIGRPGDQANHQYDLNAFWAALDSGNLPAVSFVKAPFTETGHPQDSGALAEQTFLVDTINRLQRSRDWQDMAILITYDDSDGWYDHVPSPILQQSNDPVEDSLCLNSNLNVGPAGAFNDRCGYGQRLPFLAISPFAKRNYVDHATLDTTSILRFIEDNWHLGQIDSLDNPQGAAAGQGSFDAIAGSIEGLFDFDRRSEFAGGAPVILDDTTGELAQPPLH